MLNIFRDTIIDTLKLIPFLFIAFLIIEFIEHKISSKNKKIITRGKKYGPIFGSLLGAIPQCGFSVMATNLYITRIITLGTLISIYLSTSDEMVPILMSQNVGLITITKILLIKIFIGLIYGIIIDFIIRKKRKKEQKENYHICDNDHCHCDKSIIKSTIKHTLNILIFIFISTLVINSALTYIGEENVSKILLKNSIIAPFIASIIGLIPNCGASVILTKLYLSNIVSFASLIGGLLTGSGSALLVLFKENKNIKENIKIALILYVIGASSGLIIEIIQRLT